MSDTQFFTSQISSLNVDQAATQQKLGEAQRDASLGGDDSALSEVANLQGQVSQIRSEIASAKSELEKVEVKNAQQEMQEVQAEERKRVDEETKAREKEQEDLKFLETIEHPAKDQPAQGAVATAIKPGTAAGQANTAAQTEEKPEIKATKNSSGPST